MLTPHQVISGLVAGCVLIVFGLVPGLLNSLSEGVRHFSDSLSSTLAHHPRRHEPLRQPIGLAVLGAAMILLTLMAYFAGPF